jgi:hypothetical protein
MTAAAAPSEKPTEELTPEMQRALLATGQLFRTLAQDPKTRKQVLRLVKEADPTVSFPELDLADEMEGKVKAAVKPHEETVAGLKKQVDDLTTLMSRSAFAAKEGLTEEEVLEVEDLATKAKIGDAGAAVELWRSRQTAPRASRSPVADEFLTKVRKINPRDQKALSRAVIAEGERVLRELRGARRAG